MRIAATIANASISQSTPRGFDMPRPGRCLAVGRRLLGREDHGGGDHQRPALSLRSAAFCARMNRIDTMAMTIVSAVAMVAP